MHKQELNEIMLDFGCIYDYLIIVKDYLYYNECNKEISPLLPLIELICEKVTDTYDRLDRFNISYRILE